MKKIKIFIGSSIEELANERNELARFILGLNNKYVDRGFYFEGYFCEETSSAMQAEGSQKQHNDYIENESDAAVFMFFNKAGQYTLEELDIAYQAFLSGKGPKVFVFFKTVNNLISASEEIQKCLEKVGRGYGHYYNMFDRVDTVKLELLQFLVEETGGCELKIEDGKVYAGEEEVENIYAGNVFAYQNNGKLKELKQKINDLMLKMTAASCKGNIKEILRISVELDEAQKTYHSLETEILEMLRMFSRERRKGEKNDPRRMEALRLWELGKLEEAKALITQQEIQRRSESFKYRKALAEEQFKDEAEELVKDAEVRIRLLKQDLDNKERFSEIESVFDDVWEIALKSEMFEIVYDFAAFLNIQKNYPKGIRVSERLKYAYDNPDTVVNKHNYAALLDLLGKLYMYSNEPDQAENAFAESLRISRKLAEAGNGSVNEADLAKICNNLGFLYQGTGRLADAEKYYLEALEIDRRIFEADGRPVYGSELARVYNNLGNLYVAAGRYTEAEKYYHEALEIRQRLAETVSRSAYEPDLAGTLSSVGILYTYTGKLNDAEKYDLNALEIYRRLAETVSRSAYEPDVAGACNNLGNLYAYTGRPGNAEKVYLEALEVYRRLAETVSRPVYEPDIATICNNLGIIYKGTGRLPEAEKSYLEALEIRQRLAETTGKPAYERDAAMTCNNLGNFYADTGRPGEAEKYYLEAFEIDQRLVKTASGSAYEPAAALTCSNLGNLYTAAGRVTDAEKYYLEALEIRRKLAETVSRPAYEPDLAATLNNLGALYADQGRPNEAEKYYFEAMEIFRRLAETRKDHASKANLAMICRNLAELYEKTGRNEEAEIMTAEAERLKEDSFQ